MSSGYATKPADATAKPMRGPTVTDYLADSAAWMVVALIALILVITLGSRGPRG